jgi:predicted nuclease of predicted toxin-antitoxin system
VAPRFLIDENLSPLLAYHHASTHGFDAVHVRDRGLLGASDENVLALAITEDRVVVTSNADDFRKLGARTPNHAGLAILRDAVGRINQLVLGVGLADAIERAGSARGQIFEIDRTGMIRHGKLP